MKHPFISSLGLAVLAAVPLGTPAFAVINIEWVTVGNPGNPPESTPIGAFGAVEYAYMIAKNEMTISQYAEFLNAVAKTDTYGLYSTNMASDTRIAGISRSGSDGSYSYSVIGSSGNKPITYVSWFDAARFCNWMHNGQGNGDTETGAYNLLGATSGIILKGAAAKVWIPSENEWYKAAYYDPTKGGTYYWVQATPSDTLAGNTIGEAHSANYFDGDYVGTGTSTIPTSDALTDVGAYGTNSASHYGTNDQGGNVYEWNDVVWSGSLRGRRGGYWLISEIGLSSQFRIGSNPSNENFYLGFRVASVAEPTSVRADFGVTSVSVKSGGSQLQLIWTSEPSASYSIEDSPDLTAQSWTELATGIPSQGSTTTHTLAITPSPRRFFRVAKQP